LLVFYELILPWCKCLYLLTILETTCGSSRISNAVKSHFCL